MSSPVFSSMGRATTHAFARSEGAKNRVTRCRIPRPPSAVVQADVADADAVEAAAERIENELGPIEVWVNNDMTGVFSPNQRDDSRRIQKGDRGHLPWFRERDSGRSKADVAARPRANYSSRGAPCGLSAGIPLQAMKQPNNSIGLKADFLKKLNRSRLFSNQPWRPKPSYAHGAMIGVRSTSAFRP